MTARPDRRKLAWVNFFFFAENRITKISNVGSDHSYISIWQWFSCPPSTSNYGICYMGTAQSLTVRKYDPKELWHYPSTHPCSSLPYPNHYTSKCGLQPFLRLHTKGRQLVSFFLTSFLAPTSTGKDMS
jgi:hypothetical protein